MKNNHNKLEDKLTDAGLLGIGCLVTGATLLVSPFLLIYYGCRKLKEKFNEEYHLKQEIRRARKHFTFKTIL